VNILAKTIPIACLILVSTFVLANPSFAVDSAQDALVRFADQILSNQLSDGAIVMGDPTTPPFEVIPYFSNLAAIGLMKAYDITFDPRYLNAAQSWATWYIGHQNADGTIYDYTGTVGTWSPDYDYDSTDSYASTFLEVTQKILLHTPADQPLAQMLTRAVPGLLYAQQLTMQPDSLTQAKPGYDFAFLEDNIEVYRGMIAASEISSWDRTGLQGPADQAENTRYAIETLLFMSRNPIHYAIGIAGDETIEDISSLKYWYPDQQIQLMAVAWLPSSADRVRLYNYLKGRFYYALPGRISNESQFDKIVWWAMAAQNMKDTSAERQLTSKLISYNPASPPYNVGLNGHACRVLADAIKR